MNVMLRGVFGGAMVLGIGCFANISGANAEAATTVKNRAAFELDCPQDKLSVVVLADGKGTVYYNDLVTSYGVTGCERKAVYVRTHDGQWVMNSDARPAGSAR